MKLPRFDQVLELPVQLTRTVPADYEDQNGHMNIQHYLVIAASGITAAFDDLRIDDEYRNERGMGMFTVEQHLGYFAECHTGDELTVHTRFIERSSRALHAMSFLVNQTTERLAHTLETTFIHVNMSTRRPVDIPADLADRMDQTLARTSGLAWAVPTCGSMGVRRQATL